MAINIDNFFKNIKYNTLQKLKFDALVGGFGAGVSVALHSNDLVYGYLFSVLYAWGLSYLATQNGSQTKDVREVRELYYKFIANYSELNKTFELTNPLEIYELFNKMLYGGLLSKDGTFILGAEDARDITSIEGANICRGLGVCRHISVVLSDILNESGVNSDVMLGLFEELPMDAMTKLSIQELAKAFGIDSDPELKVEIPKFKGDANHLITVAKKDGLAYYLDSTHRCTHRVHDSINDILINSRGLMKLKDSKFKLDEYRGLSTAGVDEEVNAAANMKALYEDNRDIFTKFYYDNKEIYAEIDGKMIKMVKRILK